MIPTRLLVVSATALGLASAAVTATAGSIAGYGVRTGVAASTIHGDHADALGSGARMGFSGSLFCRFSLGRMLSVQPELGWTSKGEQRDLGITYTPTTGPDLTPQTLTLSYDRRIDYLEIPVLLRLGFPNGSSFEPYLLGGPGVAFRTGSGLELQSTSTAIASGYGHIQRATIFEGAGTFDDPHYRDVDWSAIAGGGLAWGRAPLRVVVESRYALGLAGVFADTDRSVAHNGSWITTLGIELR